jgi:type IV pilus assembly protein PilA
MFCASCGKKNSNESSFCFSCGAALTPPRPSSAAAHAANSIEIETATNGRQGPVRPGVVSLLAVLQFIAGGFLALMPATLLTMPQIGLPEVLVAVLLGFLGALQLRCGFGLWNLKRYGRTIQLVFSWIGLIAFPIGTIVSILILVYLYKPGVKILFSEKRGGELTAEEAMHLTTVRQGSSLAVALIVAIVLFVGVAVIGISAAIAVPGLLRARMSGNEAAAIGALRSINAAQTTFAATCGSDGYAGSLDDLARPPLGSTIGFVQPALSTNGTVQNGYLVTLIPDAKSVTVTDASRTCNGAIAISSYFAEAHPVTVGSTGQRSFATDSRGTIYVLDSGQPVQPGMVGAAVLR